MFSSFFLAGFESSTHRRCDGRRLDLLEATGHIRYARQDYGLLKAEGITATREALRWHLIETRPGHYDFGSAVPLVKAAREQGIEVVWDLLHYGWPDDLDIFRPEFVRRFAAFASAATEFLANETGMPPLIAPVDEISYFSWAGGEVGQMNPCTQGRGSELKAQLVRAAIEATEAVWAQAPAARILHVDPLIHVAPAGADPAEARDAEGFRLAQYQAWDMLAGRTWPQLGGDEKYLDIIGVNFYPWNEWVHNGPVLSFGDRRYRPLRAMLEEVYTRYGRPMLIAEASCEGEFRREWLRYIGAEARAAIGAGIPLEGVCLYPVLDYPGWDDERYCDTGLWSYPDESGRRETCEPLACELRRQIRLVEALRSRSSAA